MTDAVNNVKVPLSYIGNLTALRDSLINDKANVKLDMKTYTNVCNSTACAIGYAFHYGIGNTEKYMHEALEKRANMIRSDFRYSIDYETALSEHINYSTYSDECLIDNFNHIIVTDKSNGVEYQVQTWAFLFSPKNTNDFDDLIHRLNLVIKGDKKPMLEYLLKNVNTKYRRYVDCKNNVTILSVKSQF